MKKATRYHFKRNNSFSNKVLNCLFIFTIILCFNIKILSQIPFPCVINNLGILPLNPSQTDIVKLNFDVSFPSELCILDSSNVTINNFQISVFTRYTTGSSPILCHSIDTIIVGDLIEGDYSLAFTAIRTYNLVDTECYCTDTLYFTVSKVNFIQKPLSEHFFTIYPNPGNSETRVEIELSGKNNIKIEISDLRGVIMLSQDFSNIISKDIYLQTDKLPEGLYFINVYADKELVGIQKWIKIK